MNNNTIILYYFFATYTLIAVKLEIKAFKTIINLKFKILVYYLVDKKT